MDSMMPFEHIFRDKEGFTTVGVALALLITLSLIFSSAQVYRINSVSAETQAVADAASLAAMNEVAEFVIVVRFCDAVLLTLSLTGLVALGLGVAALCTPATFALSDQLLHISRQIFQARDSFARQAADALNKLQRALPVLAAANAMSVAQANGSSGKQYVSLVVLVPWEGEGIVVNEARQLNQAFEQVNQNAAGVKEQAQQAEIAAEKANQEKLRAYNHDCGFNPSYCLLERSSSLAGLAGAKNPYFGSVDAWSYSVALERAKSYYAARKAQEAPDDLSVDSQARSVLRGHLYDYALKQLATAYVVETEDSFQAYFPLLPKNTTEMRSTLLYTQKVYPITSTDEGAVMHAWTGCPGAVGFSSYGSVSQMEAGGFRECDRCGFSAASLGKVAAASSSVETGFEFHYRRIAESAQAYEQARKELDPLSHNVKETASGLFNTVIEAAQSLAGNRLQVNPPGSQGVIALVANTGPVSLGFTQSFIASPNTLGARAAIAAATLVEEPSGEAGDVISSALDGLADDGGVAVGAASIVLDCWAQLLQVYSKGQQALKDSISTALNAIPFASASGLGEWASSSLEAAIERVGLQPANVNACKPVLVNSYHIALQGTNVVSAHLLSIKQSAAAYGGGSVSQLAQNIGHMAVDSLLPQDGVLRIASIRLAGLNGLEIPLEIALPSSVYEMANGLINRAADMFAGMTANITGVRIWE